jgi:hypothetical protein
MSRNNTNNVTTQNYIELIKTLIENNEFEQAFLILINLTQVKNITRDQIKQKLIERGLDNETYASFDNYHMGQLPQQEIRRRPSGLINSLSNSNTHSPNRKRPSNKNKNKNKKPMLSSPKSLNKNKNKKKKRPSNKKKSGSPVIRRRLSGLINSLSNSNTHSPNRKRSSKKKQTELPRINRRKSSS